MLPTFLKTYFVPKTVKQVCKDIRVSNVELSFFRWTVPLTQAFLIKYFQDQMIWAVQYCPHSFNSSVWDRESDGNTMRGGHHSPAHLAWWRVVEPTHKMCPRPHAIMTALLSLYGNDGLNFLCLLRHFIRKIWD